MHYGYYLGFLKWKLLAEEQMFYAITKQNYFLAVVIFLIPLILKWSIHYSISIWLFNLLYPVEKQSSIDAITIIVLEMTEIIQFAQ